MRILIFLFCLMVPVIVFSGGASSIGQLADNIVEPISVLTNFIYSACVILGTCALFGAFLRYMQYRVNPLASPISSVLILLIIGVVLICLPLVSHLTDNAIPYHYF